MAELIGLDPEEIGRPEFIEIFAGNRLPPGSDALAAVYSGHQFGVWAGQLGGFDALVNRASATWRGLPPNRKAPGSDPEWLLLLREYPALVKRPVLEAEDGTVTLGFSDAAWKRLLLP